MDKALLFVLFAGGAFLVARARQHSREIKRGDVPGRGPETAIDLQIEPVQQDRTVFMAPGDRITIRGAQPPGTQWQATIAEGGTQHVSVFEQVAPTTVPGFTVMQYTVDATTSGTAQIVFRLVEQEQTRASAVITVNVQ